MVVLTGARGEAGPDGGIGWGCGGRGSFGGGEANGGGRLARRRLQRRRAATGGVEKAAAAGVAVAPRLDLNSWCASHSRSSSRINKGLVRDNPLEA